VDQGGKLSVVYKGSPKYRTPLYRIKAVAQDSAGNLFFCDTGSMDVWRMSPDGTLVPLTGERLNAKGSEQAAFDPAAAYAGKLDKPMALALDPDGNPVIADLGLGAIVRVPAGGGEPQEIVRVPAPRGIAADREGSFVVVSHGKDQLLRVSASGEVTPIVKGALAPKNFPHHVVVDQSGYIVSDGYARAIWRVTSDGKVKAIVQGDPLLNPVGIALEQDGSLLVIDPKARKLFRVTMEGRISEVLAI
jgi:glucose/arabinose dehydrogenase